MGEIWCYFVLPLLKMLKKPQTHSTDINCGVPLVIECVIMSPDANLPVVINPVFRAVGVCAYQTYKWNQNKIENILGSESLITIYEDILHPVVAVKLTHWPIGNLNGILDM